MLNILKERLIRIATSHRTRWASLPEVYDALMADEVDAFPALRPHQRHAWHAFLSQLAAMAMYRAGVTVPPEDAAEWVGLLRGLTPDWPDDEPWQLVEEDITKPAFMQPPARSADKLADYKSRVTTADELDMLVTSKNHDLKASVVSQAGVDDWIFALITLQTMEGYGGRYNYGISRMTSGYGNRPAFSITPFTRISGHVRRDITALLRHRQAILHEYPVTDGGIGLLWIEPWDGTGAETLTIDRMEPLYIEICRRVRMQYSGGTLQTVRANSDSQRIYDNKGLTGDPWAPVSKAQVKRGETTPKFLRHIEKLGYERIVDGLFSPDWGAPFLLQLIPEEQNSTKEMSLVARGLVRNKGENKLETWGYHERIISLNPGTAQIFGRGGGKKEIGDIARERIEQASKVKSILRYAVAIFASAGRTNDISSENWSRANPWSDKLEEIIDVSFFDDLQEETDETDRDERERIRNLWLENVVIANAVAILGESQTAIPCTSNQELRAISTAQSVFMGSIYQEFNVSLEEPEEDQ